MAGVFNWTGGGADANWTTTGNWSLSSGDNLSGTAGIPDAGDTAIFGAVAAAQTTVNLSAPLTVDTVNFNSGVANNFILNTSAASTLTVASSFNVSTGFNTNVDVNHTLGGNMAINMGGNGILSLNAANTYTGTTAANTGTIRLGNATALGTAAGDTQIGSAGSIDLNGQTIGAEPVTMGGAGNGGNGSIINSNATAASLSGTIGLLNNSTIGGANAITLSGIISGGFGLTKVGVGTTTLSGVNTYTGVTTLSNGTLSVATIGNGGAAGNLGQAAAAASNIVFNGGTLAYTGATAATNRAFTINAGVAANIGVTNGTNTLTISGAVPATTGSLTKSGAGSLTLSGANNYSGGTSLTAGVLTAGNNSALGSGTVTITGVRLAVGNGITIPNNLVVNANAGASGRGLIEGANAGTATINGTITINAGTPAGGHFASGSSGSGTLALNGAITASVAVSQRLGTVRYNGGGAGFANLGAGVTNFLVTGVAIVGVANGIPTNAVMDLAVSGAGTLNLNGVSQSLAAIERSAAQTAIVTNGVGATTSTLTITAGGGTANAYPGIIQNGTGTIAVSITGGTQVLSGANTYTGATSVNGGTLLVDGSLAAGSAVTVGTTAGSTLGGIGTINGSVTLNSNGTLNPGPIAGTGTLTVANNVTFNSGSVFAPDINGGTTDRLTVTGAGSNVTFSTVATTPQFTPNVLLSMPATTTVTLIDLASNSMSTGFGNIPAATGSINLSNRPHNYNYGGGTGNDLTLTSSGNLSLTWDGGGADNNWSTAANWVSDILPAAGDSLTFDDTGVAARPVPVNNFTAGTSFGTITINSTSSYNITGNSVALATGVVDNSTGAFSNTVGIILGGAAATVAKNSTSTLVLSGVNTFAGGSTIKAGTLSGTTSAAAFGTGTITIGDSTGSANATLSGGAAHSNVIIVASGNTGVATITSSAAATFSGSVTLNSHDLTTDVGATTLALSGAIGGTGNLSKTGTGTLTLSGAAANTYIGSTTVRRGNART